MKVGICASGRPKMWGGMKFPSLEMMQKTLKSCWKLNFYGILDLAGIGCCVRMVLHVPDKSFLIKKLAPNANCASPESLCQVQQLPEVGYWSRCPLLQINNWSITISCLSFLSFESILKKKMQSAFRVCDNIIIPPSICMHDCHPKTLTKC